jgi:hypothetical protein
MRSLVFDSQAIVKSVRKRVNSIIQPPFDDDAVTRKVEAEILPSGSSKKKGCRSNPIAANGLAQASNPEGRTRRKCSTIFAEQYLTLPIWM